MPGRTDSISPRSVARRSSPRNRRPWTDWLALAVSGAAVLFLGASIAYLVPMELRAQAPASAKAVAAGPNKALEHGFSIPYDDRLTDSLTKFEELVQSHTWEKAFRILADVPEQKWESMLPNAVGFVRPASLRVRETILELPADGREAYRLFFDAKARLLFDSVRTAQKEEDVRIARAIYDRYFITSVGDDAADRLADDSFQRGDFAEAARCWQSIFEFHPDTNLSEPKLRLKRAIALFRAGLKDEFASAQQQLERDFPTANVMLGGREVNVVDYLKTLAADSPTAAPREEKTTAGPQGAFAGLAPAGDAKPAWRFPFLKDEDWAAVQASVRNFYGSVGVPAVVPAADTDGKQIYCNWLGAVFAIDAAKGRIVWKNQDPKSVVNRLKNNDGRSMFMMTNMSQYALAVGKGIVLTVSTGSNQNNWFRLSALNSATGKPLWTSEHGASGLGRLSFIGTPLIDGEGVLVVSSHGSEEGNAHDLSLRRLELQTGREEWSLPLGNPQLVGDSDWGRQFIPVPALTLSGSRLYILTNDGALLAVDLGRRRLEWAFKYEPPTNTGNGQRFFRMNNGGEHRAHSECPIIVRDGVIYFKEASSPTLFAVEESGPRLKWKWQDSDAASLVGIDEKNLYLFSDELSAIDRQKPALRWSHLLPVESQGMGPRVGSKAIVVFTPRGLFEISKAGEDRGDVFRGADLGVAAGFILSAEHQMICVSNMAVTAYPEPGGP